MRPHGLRGAVRVARVDPGKNVPMKLKGGTCVFFGENSKAAKPVQSAQERRDIILKGPNACSFEQRLVKGPVLGGKSIKGWHIRRTMCPSNLDYRRVLSSRKSRDHLAFQGDAEKLRAVQRRNINPRDLCTGLREDFDEPLLLQAQQRFAHGCLADTVFLGEVRTGQHTIRRPFERNNIVSQGGIDFFCGCRGFVRQFNKARLLVALGFAPSRKVVK